MATKRTRAEYDELGNAARKWAAEADHARQMVASLKQCMDTLQGGDWVGQGARAFYAEMNGQVMPALQRLVKALESASRTTQSISRAVHEAEQAAAGVLNGRDAAGGLGAGGLAGALGLAGMAGVGALGSDGSGDSGGSNAGGANGADSAVRGGDSGPFSVSDFGVGDRIRTGGIDTTSSSSASGDSNGGRGDGDGAGGEGNNGPFTVRDYGVGDSINSGSGGMNAAAAGATAGGGGDPSGGGSSGGGSSGGGGQPSGGGGSGGGGDQAQQLDELDQALQSGDPQKIAAALKSQLLKGNQGAMEKFRRLSASMEMQVANAMLLTMSSAELTQLSGSPATQQAMNELSGLRR